MTTLSRPYVRDVINRIMDPWEVWVPAPENKGLAVKLFLSEKHKQALFRDRRATAMAQYFGHIHGKTAYIDDQGTRHAIDNGGLLKGATALFRGVKREMFAPGWMSEYTSTFPPRSMIMCTQQTASRKRPVPSGSKLLSCLFSRRLRYSASTMSPKSATIYGATEGPKSTVS